MSPSVWSWLEMSIPAVGYPVTSVACAPVADPPACVPAWGQPPPPGTVVPADAVPPNERNSAAPVTATTAATTHQPLDRMDSPSVTEAG